MCCRFDTGYVFLSQNDLHRMATGLGQSVESITHNYCRRVNLGVATRLSLREQDNKDCVFWINGECSIYRHRPLQCRTFPFWPAHLGSRAEWDEVERECPGVNIGGVHDAGEIRAHLEAHRRELLL